MQTIHSITNQSTQIQSYRPAGGRIASDAYCRALSDCEDFDGLEEGVDRYALLLLVKKLGQHAGFTPRMISLLDYYMAYTRDVDWEEGSRPIVYQSLSRTALDMGVSERQIQKLEKALFEAGAISWHDSGNHRRYGQRNTKTGRISYAFGVDLTPLAYLREELEEKLHEKQLYDQAWMETKRNISACRRQIRALLDEWHLKEGACDDELAQYVEQQETIAIQIRTHLRLETIRELLARHKSLVDALQSRRLPETSTPHKQPVQEASIRKTTPKRSPKGAPEFAQQSTTQEPLRFCSPQDAARRESPPPTLSLHDRILSAGLQHVTLGAALKVASERLKAWLPDNPTWLDLIEAAYRVRDELDISQSSWAEACELLGRTGAAVCMVVADRAALRTENRVREPAAYFRGMVNRGRRGELRLYRSVFALIEK